MSISAGAIRAGQAYVELFGKDKTDSMFRSVGAKLKKIGRGVAGVGAMATGAATAVLGPIAGAVGKFTSYGDQLDKINQRRGLTVGFLSEIGFAAEQSGSSLEVLAKGQKKLNTQLLDAERGSTEALDNFRDLGIAWEEIAALSPDEQFTRVTDALGAMGDETKQNALAQKLLGRAGDELVPLFGKIAELRREAAANGLTVDPEDAKAAARLADAWNRIKRAAGAGVFNVGASFAESLAVGLESITPFIVGVGKFIKENKTLVMSLGTIAAIVGVVGVSLIALGATIGVVGFAVGGLSTLVAVLGGVLAFLASPLGILIGVAVAAVAATVAVLHFSGALKAMAAVAGKVFAGVREIFGETFGAIATALKSGDIAKAGEIAWLGLQAVTIRILANVLHEVKGFIKKILQAFEDVGALGFDIVDVDGLVESVVSPLDAAVEISRAKLKAAIKELNDARAAAGEGSGSGSDAGGGAGGGIVRSGLLAGRFKNFESRGSFSGIGASRVRGARDPKQAEIASNTERAAKALEEIKRKRSGGFT